MFEKVLDSIQSYGGFSKEDLALFGSRLTERSVPKNSFVLKKKAVCKALFFLLEGSCVHFLPAEEESDRVVNLYTPGHWLTDYQSFTSQQPAIAYIRAFSDCRMAVLAMEAMHDLVRTSPVFFRAGRMLETLQYSDIRTLNLAPPERYHHLVEHRPDLLQAFPLKVLASYLNMAPETLSRIRNRRPSKH